jgi:hypothetical protein
VVKPSCRRQMAQQAVVDHAVSIRLACKAFSISETCYRYQPKLNDDNAFDGCLASTFNFAYLWEDYPILQAIAKIIEILK